MFNIGVAVTLGPDNLAIFEERDADAWNVEIPFSPATQRKPDNGTETNVANAAP